MSVLTSGPVQTHTKTDGSMWARMVELSVLYVQGEVSDTMDMFGEFDGVMDVKKALSGSLYGLLKVLSVPWNQESWYAMRYQLCTHDEACNGHPWWGTQGHSVSGVRENTQSYFTRASSILAIGKC